jgi:tetratricopeptide (TPR) repeat protein
MAAKRIGWILIGLVVMSAPARAEDKAAARQAHLEGANDYHLGQYAEALEAFKRAYGSYEDPSFLYNIAQCHRALGHDKEAIDAYQSYLKKSHDAPNRAEVERLIAELNRPSETDRSPAAPAPTVQAAAPSAVAASPPLRSNKPIWKRAWLWGVIGGVVVAGVAVGLGVGLGMQPRPPNANAIVGF